MRRLIALLAVSAASGSLGCDPGCAALGTCHEPLGRCDCPSHLAGERCERPAAPLCRIGQQDTGCLAFSTCACVAQCEAHGWPSFDVRACLNTSSTRLEDVLRAPVVHYASATRIPAGLAGVDPSPSSEAGKPLEGASARPAAECPLRCKGRGLCVQYTGAPPRCECSRGTEGASCESTQTRDAAVCPGDCSGRGRCFEGWCHCEAGAYGADCALTGRERERLAWDAIEGDAELRPRVYVHTLPPALSAWLQQTTPERNLAMQLHERLLASRYRTADPERADYFFVPVAPMGLPAQPGQQSHYQAVRAAQWIAETFPEAWRRQGGADHLFAWGWDFGSCPVGGHPLLNSSIHLSHFGLTTKDRDHACDCELCAPYAPLKDVVVPDTFELFIKRHATRRPQGPRENLVFFSGYPTSKERRALFSHNFTGPGVRVVAGRVKSIVDELFNATFCISTTGAGFGSRGTLAVVFGCIPVAVVDAVAEPFEDVLDWNSFGVRVPEAQLGNLLDILRAIPPEAVRAKQAALECVAEHYVWSSIHGALGVEDGTRDAFEVLMYALRNKLVGGSLPPIRCGAPIPGAPSAPLRDLCRFHGSCGTGSRYDLPAGGAACGGGSSRPC